MSKQTDLINVTDAITVDGSNVGIGTSSPTGALHVSRSGLEAGITLERTTSATAKFTMAANDGKLVFTDQNQSEARMTIDSSGRVTMPYQPAFYGTYTGVNVSWANNQTFGWNIVHMNVGNHFNGGTGLFTAPVAGVYSFNYNTWASSGPTQVCFKVNGTDWRPTGADTQGVANISPTNGQQTGGATLLIPLAVGDYVHVGMRTGFADTMYMGHSHFSGYLIG